MPPAITSPPMMRTCSSGLRFSARSTGTPPFSFTTRMPREMASSQVSQLPLSSGTSSTRTGYTASCRKTTGAGDFDAGRDTGLNSRTCLSVAGRSAPATVAAASSDPSIAATFRAAKSVGLAGGRAIIKCVHGFFPHVWAGFVTGRFAWTLLHGEKFPSGHRRADFKSARTVPKLAERP